MSTNALLQFIHTPLAEKSTLACSSVFANLNLNCSPERWVSRGSDIITDFVQSFSCEVLVEGCVEYWWIYISCMTVHLQRWNLFLLKIEVVASECGSVLRQLDDPFSVVASRILSFWGFNFPLMKFSFDSSLFFFSTLIWFFMIFVLSNFSFSDWLYWLTIR